MWITRSLSAVALCVSLLTVGLSAQTPTVTPPQEPAARTSIMLGRQLLRFTTKGESLEWQLVPPTRDAAVVCYSSGIGRT